MAHAKKLDGELIDLVQDYAQRAVEALCAADVLKEIPIIKTALVAKDAITSIRDEMLLQKLRACLTELSDMPQGERQQMVSKLESDPAYGRRVGEHLIELLDRVESQRKPAMVGKAFAAYGRGKIQLAMLQRLIGAIERLPTYEIDTVRRFVNSSNDPPERQRIDPESIQALTIAGLTAPAIGPIGGNLGYNWNPTCSMFVELNLDVQ
jgi:hypothetical protein